MMRLLVILTAIVFGLAASAGYVAVASQGIVRPPQAPGVPWKATPAEDRMIFEACIVFFAVVYAIGVFCYRRLGAWSEQATVRETSQQHLPVLHLAGAVPMLGFHLPKVWNGKATAGDVLSLAVGTVLLCAAVIGFDRVVRKYHPFGLGRHRV